MEVGSVMHDLRYGTGGLVNGVMNTTSGINETEVDSDSKKISRIILVLPL